MATTYKKFPAKKRFGLARMLIDSIEVILMTVPEAIVNDLLLDTNKNFHRRGHHDLVDVDG